MNAVSLWFFIGAAAMFGIYAGLWWHRRQVRKIQEWERQQKKERRK